MNFKSTLKKIDSKEILTCILLIVVGYMTAQLFMRQMNGFRVGIQSAPDFCKGKCNLGKQTYVDKSSGTDKDPCFKLNKDTCGKSWYQSNTLGGGNNKTPIGIGCYWNEKGNGCVTPGTGFHSSSGCPSKACDPSKPSPPSPPAPVPSPTTYSYNASTSKCESDPNGSYTNASNCQSDCDVSMWDWPANTFRWYSWPISTPAILFILIIFFVLMKSLSNK